MTEAAPNSAKEDFTYIDYAPCHTTKIWKSHSPSSSLGPISAGRRRSFCQICFALLLGSILYVLFVSVSRTQQIRYPDTSPLRRFCRCQPCSKQCYYYALCYRDTPSSCCTSSLFDFSSPPLPHSRTHIQERTLYGAVRARALGWRNLDVVPSGTVGVFEKLLLSFWPGVTVISSVVVSPVEYEHIYT